MASITTINGTDVISTSRSTINTNFANLNSDKIETSYLDTDTTLAANSDSKIATQKAVKTYVDTSGGQNASETVRGIVEEATSAEVTAGTDTGGTGAKLFVPPSKLNTQITSLVTSTLASRVPFAQQLHGTNLTTEDPGTAGIFSGCGSSTDGSVLIVSESDSYLKRYARDTNTGMYYLTHTINPSLALTGLKNNGVIVIGSFVYVIYDGGTNFAATRFALADLTGETTMTVPTVTATGTNSVVAWTDGTYAYWVGSNVGTTTVNKWSVSGTTFSAVSTGTCVATNGGSDFWSSVYDGTNIYLVKYTKDTSFVVTKLADAMYTSATSTTTYLLPSIQIGSSSGGCISAVIDSTKMYIGNVFVEFNATAQYTIHMILSPYTKP